MKKMGRVRKILYKLSLALPASRYTLLEQQYEIATLVKYVKELEAINRSDILVMATKIRAIEEGIPHETFKTEKKEKFDKGGLEYQ